jgi:hypothetical protein
MPGSSGVAAAISAEGVARGEGGRQSPEQQSALTSNQPHRIVKARRIRLDLRKIGLAGLIAALFVAFGAFTAATPSSISANDECPTPTPTATATPTPTPTSTPNGDEAPTALHENLTTLEPECTETPAASKTPTATATPKDTPEADDTPTGVVITPPNTGDAGLGSEGTTSLFVLAAVVTMALAGLASFRFARGKTG